MPRHTVRSTQPSEASAISPRLEGESQTDYARRVLTEARDPKRAAEMRRELVADALEGIEYASVPASLEERRHRVADELGIDDDDLGPEAA